jgi:DNA-binding NarL/FixJ family response regulator
MLSFERNMGLNTIRFKMGKAISQKYPILTSNELLICGLIKSGLNNYAPSDFLNFTTSTVRKERCLIYKKIEMITDK